MTPSIAVRFCDLGWPIISPLISWHSGSWINHCDLVLNAGLVSAMPVSGVRLRTPASLPAKRELTIALHCTPEQHSHAAVFAAAQIGKHYDYFGTLAFPFRPPWNDKGRWFCSELTAACLHEAGIITVPKKASRISPAYLFQLCGGIER